MMRSEALFVGFEIGVAMGTLATGFVHASYRRWLLRCARKRFCERLPDGRYYRLVEEDQMSALERFTRGRVLMENEQ